MTKTPLFIDFDGVISYEYLRSSWKGDEKARQIEQVFFVPEQKARFEQWMRWEFDSKQACRIIQKETGLDFQMVYDTLIHDCKNRNFPSEIIMKLDDLVQKYDLIIATVNVDVFDTHIVPHHTEVFDKFKKIINSYDTWYTKKDDHGLFFSPTLEELWKTFQESILIDDSSPNCERFEILGWKSYCVKGEKDVLNIFNQLS